MNCCSGSKQSLSIAATYYSIETCSFFFIFPAPISCSESHAVAIRILSFRISVLWCYKYFLLPWMRLCANATPKCQNLILLQPFGSSLRTQKIYPSNWYGNCIYVIRTWFRRRSLLPFRWIPFSLSPSHFFFTLTHEQTETPVFYPFLPLPCCALHHWSPTYRSPIQNYRTRMNICYSVSFARR